MKLKCLRLQLDRRFILRKADRKIPHFIWNTVATAALLDIRFSTGMKDPLYETYTKSRRA